jgi:hypothetical protein
MTFTHRALTIAAAFALSGVTVSAQVPMQPPGQKYVGPVLAAPHVDVTARVDLLDERIAMLTADMRMFVGELKIQVMADLIEALIERQTLTDRTMRRMHEMMGDWMIDREEDAPVGPRSDTTELEPEMMCSPYI